MSTPSFRARHARPGRSGSGDSGTRVHLGDIVGASPRMQRIFRLVAKVAQTDSTVLLLGESGTGKELIARSIHLQSRRANGPFVAVNVGALPESLMEAELFGHRRGAFTGAESDRRGLIEEADGGTLFLDEIGDMPTATQVKLLRVLENSELRRVGENETRHVDVRVVAATHHDLLSDVEAGRFRGDLYYRLNVVQVALPPLRERREDIGLLASYFLERTAERWNRPALSFSSDAMTLLEHYDYPGNVRELENAIEHAVTVAEGTVVTPADLPATLRASRQLAPHGEVVRAPASSRGTPAGSGAGAAHSTGDRFAHESGGARAEGVRPREEWSLAEIEKEHIRRVLALHHGNATTAAKQLGISRTTLWRKLRGYGLARRDH